MSALDFNERIARYFRLNFSGISRFFSGIDRDFGIVQALADESQLHKKSTSCAGASTALVRTLISARSFSARAANR
jgi:hypothetical protein